MEYNYTHYYIITINLTCCVFYFCRTLSSSLCLFVHLFMLQLPGRRFGSNHPGWKARQLCAVHSRSHPLLPPLRVSHCTGPQTRSALPCTCDGNYNVGICFMNVKLVYCSLKILYFWCSFVYVQHYKYSFNKSIYFCLASGTSRRPWVLGKVMEKEYCQAKKVLYSFQFLNCVFTVKLKNQYYWQFPNWV